MRSSNEIVTRNLDYIIFKIQAGPGHHRKNQAPPLLQACEQMAGWVIKGAPERHLAH